MLKDTIAKNDAVNPNDREMAVLRENFPSCFRADGTFDIERFQEYLTDKVASATRDMSLNSSARIMPACSPPWIRLPSSFPMRNTMKSPKTSTVKIFI